MTSRAGGSRRRLAGVAALVAGIAIAASEALRRIHPAADDAACDSGASYAINAVDLVKHTATGVAVLLLVALTRDHLSRNGRTLALVGAVGSITTGIANGVEHCAQVRALGVLYALGLVVSIFPTIGFGILLGRVGGGAGWVGALIAAGTLAYLVGAEPGWGLRVQAITWTVVGVTLLTRSGIALSAAAEVSAPEVG